MASQRRIVITGSRGIAAEVIHACSKRGYSTFIVGGEEEDSRNLAESITRCAGFSAIDLRSESAVESVFALANKELGGITDVIAVAGGSGRSFGDGPLDSLSRSAWDKTLELNLTTAFLTLREGLKVLSESGGSITLTSSVLGSHPSPLRFGTQAYAVSKAAINGLVHLAAASYVDKNIRINAIAPALVATPMSRRASENSEIVNYIIKKQPLTEKALEPSDLVSSYLYLLENSAVTGQILTVDGGWSVVTDGLFQ
jgi:NAD(P)-dependent dehydrogenase (short-subunit alcohol dehydrogenase family)